MNLTVKALKNLRIQLGVSQKAVAHSMKIGESFFSKMEREENMPENIHEGYERFLFDVLNGERKLNEVSKHRVWVIAKTQTAQDKNSKRENEELAEARLKIKEYEALLGMYRKESRC